ncbi:uncharacterized protein TrAtP1_012506 [Trichoderma atroviride]|uniref:uncharacterized protein n=1 Tax=Hypocrea atroviridis TaxID=63577 RepID=UPI003323ABEA|nr:hypothetical protein TrAtP1_012506 [Trichoderma atroviride]
MPVYWPLAGGPTDAKRRPLELTSLQRRLQLRRQSLFLLLHLRRTALETLARDPGPRRRPPCRQPLQPTTKTTSSDRRRRFLCFLPPSSPNGLRQS